MNIDAFSSTGKSGINLDGFGSYSCKNKLVIWVFDGVSPIILTKKNTWTFRFFYHASKFLNEVFAKIEWNEIEVTLYNISKKISESSLKRLFTGKRFYLRPLFSIGIVSIDITKSPFCASYSLYGDCMLIFEKGNEIVLIENKKIEKTKLKLDVLFNTCGVISTMIKKAILIFIRFLQINFGFHRVYSPINFLPPEIQGVENIGVDNNIYIFSDGITWLFKEDTRNIDILLNIIKSKGTKEAIKFLRSCEYKNKSFGHNDDATILHINFSNEKAE